VKQKIKIRNSVNKSLDADKSFKTAINLHSINSSFQGVNLKSMTDVVENYQIQDLLNLDQNFKTEFENLMTNEKMHINQLKSFTDKECQIVSNFLQT